MTNQIVKISHDVEIPVLTYNGERVLTFALIDKVHSRPEGAARKRFSDNKERFIPIEDYYALDSNSLSVFRTDHPQAIGASAKHATLITESGYLILAKSFTDDLAWQVQRQLVKVYFRAKEFIQQSPPAETIDNDQRKALLAAINHISSGWALESADVNQQIYNRIRVMYSLRELNALPANKFGEALQLIQSYEPACRAYLNLMCDIKKQFVTEVLGDGEPWTPWVKRGFTKAKKELPQTPDWRALAAQIQARKQANAPVCELN